MAGGEKKFRVPVQLDYARPRDPITAGRLLAGVVAMPLGVVGLYAALAGATVCISVLADWYLQHWYRALGFGCALTILGAGASYVALRLARYALGDRKLDAPGPADFD